MFRNSWIRIGIQGLLDPDPDSDFWSDPDSMNMNPNTVSKVDLLEHVPEAILVHHLHKDPEALLLRHLRTKYKQGKL